MQATHGLAALYRSRTRLIGCLMAITLALAASVLVLASPARAAESPQKTYLGLGDSITFGYSQELFNENFSRENPHAFEEALPVGSGKPNGLVLDYNLRLQAKNTESAEFKKATNNGCPGETTDSFIGNGPVGKALEGALPEVHGEAPCAYHNVNKFELHHEYASGSQSQLENALETIATQEANAKKSRRPVAAVSLQIGSNDLLAGIKKCEAEVKEEFEKTGKSIYGETPKEAVKGCLEAHAGIFFQHVLHNTAAILFAIRNGALFGGVNYSGKIVELGFYNPYGAVFVPGEELLESSNVLEAILNFFDKKLATEFGACYANPQPYFNSKFEGKPLLEPERLQTLTNMANTKISPNNGQKNGPDIHPTPLGYEELARIMEQKCP
jgi:lysophospholipase L1-like esterase